MRKPDIEGIVARAERGDSTSHDVLVLAKWAKWLEEAILELPDFEDESGEIAGLQERCCLAASLIEKIDAKESI